MKTKMNISNLGKLGLTIFAATVMSTANLNATGKDSVDEAMINLNTFIESREQSLKYTAPAVEVYEEETAADAALESLEILAATIEESLKYQAPAEDEAVEAGRELENLEILAQAVEASLKYRVPVDSNK